MKARLPALVGAAAAADVALLVQDVGTGVICGLIACGALAVAFRFAPGAVLAMGLVTAVLLQVGVVSASAVPGVAQVSAGWSAADRWSDERAHAASCDYRQLIALSSGDAAGLESVGQECA